LYLAAPLYMLQVYDRVISSASEVTLVMLTLALLMALLALAGLDTVRARVLTRASIRLDRLLAGRIMTAIIEGARNLGRLNGRREKVSFAIKKSDEIRRVLHACRTYFFTG
jgi:ATP-binding cassette, subfamily C, bacterial